jgi:threonine dehydrogenase-like Zn-dependent dehydrogenase
LTTTHPYVNPDRLVEVIPDQMLRWELYGAGLENLGENDAPLLRAVPQPGPGELLVRVDACGICFSDIKIINLGGSHARLQGRDLQADPVVMGHEVSVTVVAAGPGAPPRFPPGQRAIVQADIYFRGVNMAFGYRISGGFSQYALIGREVLEGDEGCYLLPVAPQLGYAEAALCEPWACVEASYRYQPRRAPLEGGDTLLVLMPDANLNELRFNPPAPVGLLTIAASRPEERAIASHLSHAADGLRLLTGSDWQPAAEDAWDDIIVAGTPDAATVERLARHLKPQATLCLLGAKVLPQAELDIGRIHYQGLQILGSPGWDVMVAYQSGRDAELVPGGSAWFIGAGGPLGQMHLYRTLTLPSPPRQIVATQNTGPRLEDLRQRFEPLATHRGVALILIDPKALAPEALAAALHSGLQAPAPEELPPASQPLTEHRTPNTDHRSPGFTDIIDVVPSATVVEQAQHHLGEGGGFNLFAGVPVGTMARLDLNAVVHRDARFWGTSGSSIADLRSVLEKLERGELATDSVVAAVGGIRAVKEGLAAVRDARFMGKTMIYPQLEDLPLLSVQECAERYPTLRDKLTDGRYWNRDAEAELFRLLQ